MQPWDQVKVKIALEGEGEEEHVGRAGVVRAVEGEGEAEQCTVMLDETATHEAGEVVYPSANLEFLGR